MAHLTNFSFEFFYEIFTEDASSSILWCKNVKNDQKLKSRGPALMLRASRFSSPGIPKNRSYSDYLLETLLEDEHFNALDKCDEPLQYWFNFKPLKKLEAVGEVCVP